MKRGPDGWDWVGKMMGLGEMGRLERKVKEGGGLRPFLTVYSFHSFFSGCL